MFPPQIFEYSDIPVIGVLVLLEGLLSADNALVLAIMVRHLPEKLRHKALVYGLGGAFVFRFAAILAASWIMSLWWLQLVGALYLVWITAKHFVAQAQKDDATGVAKKVAGKGFWHTVFLVELTDIAFAVDSVLAAVTLAQANSKGNFDSKLWVVYAGAIIGVVLLRFAAGAFIKLLDKYPFLEHMAYALVGWAGVKLMVFSGHNATVTLKTSFIIPEMKPIVFWTVLALIVGVGSYLSFKRPADETSEPDPESA
ncbi:TerC family protein [Kamptonema cortianum]|nr:TerC family protein [Geitlerinema splendidum]MDK3156177.1 TerC family protein [Kamptonema cortianum]